MKTIVTGNALIPALGLGTWQLQGKHCADCVADALAAGYRHVDTAQRYDNHEAVGAGLRRSGLARDEVFLTSKLWFEHLRRDDALASMEETLKELGTDYVDLMLIHWPNPKVPLEETLEAMQRMREKGWIRHIGVSNFPPSWLEEAAELAPIVCDQVEYHPLLSQGHLLDALRAREIALIAYSPLAHGEVVDEPTLVEIGRAHERSAVQVALRWLLQQERVGAIPKASSREHVEENLRVFDFELDEEEMRRIHALARREGERTVDPDFAPGWER